MGPAIFTDRGCLGVSVQGFVGAKLYHAIHASGAGAIRTGSCCIINRKLTRERLLQTVEWLLFPKAKAHPNERQ